MPLNRSTLERLASLHPFIDERTHWRTTCPGCANPDNKFYISKTDHTFHCFHCGTNDPSSWGIPSGGLTTTQTHTIAPQSTKKHLSEDYVKKSQENLMLGKYKHLGLNYLLNKRHFSLTAIKYFRFGYDPDENAIVIPNLRQGVIQAVELRYLDPEADPKYKTWGNKRIYNFDYYIMNTRSCVLMEGAFDAASSIQLIPNLPAFGTGGKGSWQKMKLDLFKKYERVYLYFDADAEAQMLEIADRLGKHRCYIVKSPKGYKDLNDILALPNALEVYSKILWDAECVGVPLTASFGDYFKATVDFYSDKDFQGKSTGFKELDAISGAIRMGEVTTLCGTSGCGKTTLATAIAFNLAQGGLKSSVGSFELPAPQYIIPKIISFSLQRNIQIHKLPVKQYKALVKGLDQWGQMAFINRVGSLSIAELEEAILIQYKQGFKYFILDHLNYFIAPSDDSNRLVDEAMILLQKLVKNHTDMGILLVVHPRKVMMDFKTGLPRPITREDFKGSSRIIQDSDNVWILNRDLSRACVRLTVDKLRSEKVPITAGGQVDLYFDKDKATYSMIPVI